MLKPAGEAEALPQAFLRIGPATLARHQLSFALSMDCQRIVCITAGLSPEVQQLQQDVERAGARFHSVAGAHGLAALVTANDELLLIADGLLAPIDAAASILEGGHAVFVQPVEAGMAAGFERIDLNHASAGLMRIPGALAERLHELPADCDVPSALTRIALQAGIAQRPLPPEARDGLRWRLVRGEGEAHAAEAGWIALHLEHDGPFTPGSALARMAVRAFGPSMLHAGKGGNTLAIAAAAGLVIAIGLAWGGFVAAALVLWSLAWIVRRSAALLMAVEWESLGLGPEKWSREGLFGWAHDGALIVILLWNAVPYAGANLWQGAFAPLLLVCLVRLSSRLYPPALAAWLSDRSLLGIVLAVSAGVSMLMPGLQVLIAALAILAMAWPIAPFRLTSA